MKILNRWTMAFICLLTGVTASANQLDLLFYSAPKAIQWDGPTKLLRSTIKNYVTFINPQDLQTLQADNETEEQAEMSLYDQLAQARDLIENPEKRGGNSNLVAYPHGISHVNVRLHCQGSSEILLGMTGEEDNVYYLRKLLIEGGSMETITENTRGRFYSRAEVEKWLPYMKAKGKMHQLSYQLNAKTCQQVRSYLANYSSAQQDRIYGGLGTEPLKGVGAGCSAFAMSVLKVAGLYENTFEHHFTRSIRIPQQMINTLEKKADIGFYDIFFKNYSSWANPEEPHLQIHFWDPQLMYEWVKNVGTGQISWHKNHEVQWDQNSIILKVNAEKLPVPKSFKFLSAHLEKIQAEVIRLWNSL